MTAAELRARLAGVAPDMPVALLVATDGTGIDLAQPAGVVVTLGQMRRPFSDGTTLSGDVLVLVASGSADHEALIGIKVDSAAARAPSERDRIVALMRRKAALFETPSPDHVPADVYRTRAKWLREMADDIVSGSEWLASKEGLK